MTLPPPPHVDLSSRRTSSSETCAESRSVQIPAGLVTALIGTPHYIWLLARTRA